MISRIQKLKTKKVTVDGRRSCQTTVKWYYFTANKKLGSDETPLGLCASGSKGWNASQTKLASIKMLEER